MRFDPFPEDLQEALDAALSHPLRSLLEGAEDLAADSSCAWHESCRVITVDLPGSYSTTDPLKGYLQLDKEIWHHQIRINEAPIAYARSLVQPTTDGHVLQLIELVRSSLALRFDDTLDALDDLNEPVGADWVIRLLIVPRYNDAYFAVFDGEKIGQVLPLRFKSAQPPEVASPPLGGESLAGESLDGDSLLSRLKGRREFFGLRSPVPPNG